MRRFVTLAVLIFFAIPFGVSLSGCSKGIVPTYCNGQNSGVQVGQLTTLDLEPRLVGISLNQGEIGHSASPSGKDCRGNSAQASNVVYASTNIYLADIAPTTGSLCAGTWNRNTGAGIADYTVCTPTTTSGVAYVTASSGSVVSNAIPVFVHPIATSIVLGPASTNCTTDPASNCVDLTQLSGCDAGIVAATSSYSGNACLSQGQTAQLVARTFANAPSQFTVANYSIASNVVTFQTSTQNLIPGESVVLSGFPKSTFLNGQTVAVSGTGLTSSGFQASLSLAHANVATVFETGYGIGNTVPNNISCLVGPLTFTAQTPSVVTIDANGVATAAQPGSTTISANTSQASSTAGFFATCPPKTIVLSAPPNPVGTTAPISVNQNTTQPLVATVTDTNNQPITNVQLEYVSTNPTTISGASSIVPTYPSTAAITAICQPPTCNTAPYNEIGLFGNGTPVTSNPVQIAATGTNFSTVLFIGSTQSQYLLPVDFTTTTQLAPVRLPYAPNSMVLSQDLSTIYMGTPVEIMTYSTFSNSVSRQDNSISGTVLAVSPDNGTVIVTDPIRGLTYLYLAAGGVSTEYGGVATSAEWSPDSTTVYITTTDGRLLVHSTFTGWSAINLPNIATDVAITVPNAGVYLGGNPVDVRTNCPATTISGTGLNQTTSNVFYPDLGPVPGVNATELAATNDGLHILGASTSAFTDIKTNQKSGGCSTLTFNSTPGNPISLAALSATSVSNVLATSDSSFAFVTYQGTGGVVPQYTPGTGTLTNVPLQTTSNGKPLDAVSGAISADNNSLYIGSEGDNIVHILTRGATGFTDVTKPIVPALPNINGNGIATPNLIVQKPRRATS